MGKMGIRNIKKCPPVASIAHSAISKSRDRDIPISKEHLMLLWFLGNPTFIG